MTLPKNENAPPSRAQTLILAAVAAWLAICAIAFMLISAASTLGPIVASVTHVVAQ